MGNLTVKVIIADEGEQKNAYISIEGNIDIDNKDDKKKIVDGLVQAFSHVIGVNTDTPDTPADTPEIVNDFKSGNEEEPKFISEPVVEPVADKKEPQIGFGKYPNKTPSEVAKMGEIGVKYLREKIIPGIMKHQKFHPNDSAIDKAKLDAALAAVEQSETFGDVIKEIEEIDASFEGTNELCKLYGTTFEELKAKKNINLARRVRDNIKVIADKAAQAKE